MSGYLSNYSKITYIDNGISSPAYVAQPSSAISVEDRGFLFADGVYEVILVKDGVLIDAVGHFSRLKKSLAAVEIKYHINSRVFEIKIQELLRLNKLKTCAVYIQITRGAAKRAHKFPEHIAPSLTIILYKLSFEKLAEQINQGVSVITTADIRWERCDIKSVSLLPNILANQQAAEKNVRDTWMIREGVITEGSSTNAFIIDKKGILRTHPANNHILGGITRGAVLKIAKQYNFKILEQPFTLAEAKTAREAFLTSTTSGILSIVKIDNARINTGKPGKITQMLAEKYWDHVDKQVGR